MSRRGVEAKPPWSALPPALRGAVGATLGAEVRRAARAWGGYAPTATFRLTLADGRRAFFKGAGPDDSAFVRAAFEREERVYREATALIAPWAPLCYGVCRAGAWSGLLLEDLGAKSAPPWRPALARQVAGAYADFHTATRGRAFPAWLPTLGEYLTTVGGGWERLAGTEVLGRVAALAGGRADEALAWLVAARPALARAGRALLAAPSPPVLLHADTRSDNLRWHAGRLRLFDWPHVMSGPAEFDLAAFAQSVTAEGGPDPEAVVAWYAARGEVRAGALDAAVAEIAGYFAEGAWQPDIPGLPRLRAFQRAQLRVSLAWAARRLGLPGPGWLVGVG